MLKLKKIISFVLVFITAVPIFFYVPFLIKQKLVQHKMEERLENSFLQTVKINQSDVTWIKKNKEVIIGNKLFDIKKILLNGDTLILTGLFDEEESRLKKEFVGLLEQNKKESSPLHQLLIKFLLTPLIEKDSSANFALLNPPLKTVYFNFDEFTVSIILSVITPPPNNLFK